MANEPAGEKTEQPTQERLRKAREEGQIPQSKELPSALAIGALLIVLALTASGLYAYFCQSVRGGLVGAAAEPMDAEAFRGHLRGLGWRAFAVATPFLAAGAAVSVFSSVLIGGWTVSPKAAAPKVERIDPMNGLKNLVSLRSLMQLVVAVAKIVVLLWIAYVYLRGRLGQITHLVWQTPSGFIAVTARLVLGLVFRVAIALLAIGLLDWLYQRWQWKRKLRMTRHEVKEERKQYEASPETRSRMRTVQMELVRKRMMQAVPAADVVLTNPTHVAVALQYDVEEMEAPRVVAKGPDLLAEKIKEIARAHDVPVLQRPELARSIYQTVEIGQPIPQTLYVAVAEVLALVYRLRKRRALGGAATT